MKRTASPDLTVALPDGQTLRVYCTRDPRQAAADLLRAAENMRRQAPRESVVKRIESPVVTAG